MALPEINIPTKNSTANDWVIFHKRLLEYVSPAQANELWLLAWGKRGNNNDDYNLRQYMSSQGVEIKTNLLGTLKNVEEGALGVITAPFRGLSTILGVGKWVAVGFVLIILGSVSILIINIARKPIETLNAAAAAKKGLMV